MRDKAAEAGYSGALNLTKRIERIIGGEEGGFRFHFGISQRELKDFGISHKSEYSRGGNLTKRIERNV